jgi:hypothetical protein
MVNFVIPEGIRILQSKLKVTSNQLIPAFNSSYCNDGGTLTNSATYNSSTTNADFVLFLGAVDNSNEGYLAYATYCLLGTVNFYKSTFFFKSSNLFIN